MNVKILIVGSTGKLGSKLLSYMYKNNIPAYGITCFKNIKKINKQKKIYSIKNIYILSNSDDKKKFYKILEKKINIIYFLDFSSLSLKYLNYFLKYNQNSIIAVANKEMLIAGGKLLQSKIKKTNNSFIPLDSEHFSLLNSNVNKKNIQKIYITASGGPFYFNKDVNFKNVSSKKVLSHPKWKMGNNNLIDSSNFINKILEIFELSHIFNIPLNKIDFLISREAFIHSIIHYSDNTISINCFSNNMLITLIKPLSKYFNIKPFTFKQKYLNTKNLNIIRPNDKRFKIFSYKKRLLNLSHSEQIKLMIVNNSAHKLYLSNKLKYNEIIKYIMKEILINRKEINLNSFNSIFKYISVYNNYYKTNV